jgi:hypothetical protein
VEAEKGWEPLGRREVEILYHQASTVIMTETTAGKKSKV